MVDRRFETDKRSEVSGTLGIYGDLPRGGALSEALPHDESRCTTEVWYEMLGKQCE